MKKLIFIGSVLITQAPVLCSELPTKEFNADEKFTCSYENCRKNYTTLHGLRVHITAIHKDERPFECPVQDCHMTFASSGGLYKHKHMHVDECRYACNYPGCAAKYVAEFTLNRHKKIAHTQSLNIAPDTKHEIASTDKQSDAVNVAQKSVARHQGFIAMQDGKTGPAPYKEAYSYAQVEPFELEGDVEHSVDSEDNVSDMVTAYAAPLTQQNAPRKRTVSTKRLAKRVHCINQHDIEGLEN